MHLKKYKDRIYTISHKRPEFKVGCVFQAEKYRSDGTITYKGPKFHNTVLDVGLDLLVSYDFRIDSGLLRYLNVGTGTSEPAVTQTGLINRVASTSSFYGSVTEDGQTTGTCYEVWKATFAFAVGFLSANTNLTELGLSQANNSNYYNRQLFRDELGDPTVIPVQDDEGLRVYCEAYLYADMSLTDSDAGSFDIGTTTYNYTRELTSSWVNATPGARRTRVGQMDTNNLVQISNSTTAFTGTSATSRSVDSYVAGSFERSGNFVWSPGSFAGEINTVAFLLGHGSGSEARYSAFRLDSPITVQDTEELTLQVKRSWGRV